MISCCKKIISNEACNYLLLFVFVDVVVTCFPFDALTRLAKSRSILKLTGPVVKTGFNRSLLVDCWSIGGRLGRLNQGSICLCPVAKLVLKPFPLYHVHEVRLYFHP